MTNRLAIVALLTLLLVYTALCFADSEQSFTTPLGLLALFAWAAMHVTEVRDRR